MLFFFFFLFHESATVSFKVSFLVFSLSRQSNLSCTSLVRNTHRKKLKKKQKICDESLIKISFPVA